MRSGRLFSSHKVGETQPGPRGEPPPTIKAGL